MKKLHVYDLYLDDGHDCFKVIVPAPSKAAAVDYCQGNGTIVAVRDSDLQDIDLGCLSATLTQNDWGKQEIDLICRALTYCGLDRN